MTLILKQSTSIDIRVGPFVDATDAVSPEAGITLGAADQAEVLKADGAATAAMAGTFAAVTGADGWYDYTVATGDVDTVGEVVFVVQDSSVCLPVFVRGYVVEEAIYDAIFAATASLVTDIRDAILPKINTALSDIPVLMVLASDHVSPATGLTVIATRSIDGGTTFSATTGTVTEATNGLYHFDASAADMNGALVTFKFSVATADDTFVSIRTGG